jgi:hypothetical protein
MRRLIQFAALLALSVAATGLCASPPDNKTPEQQALESIASQAQPREQCFLYAMFVRQMTELSSQQYAAGNVEVADRLLRQVQLATKKIHLSLANNDKHLKDAEILLHNAAFRLNEMLQASDFEDRPLVEQTLAQVNQAQSETMLQVFSK